MKTEIRTRKEMEQADTWALEDLYATAEDWKRDCDRIRELLQEFTQKKDAFAESAKMFSETLALYVKLNAIFERVYVYANQLLHQDMGDSISQEYSGEASVLQNELSTAVSWLEPMILEIPDEQMASFQEEPCLKPYSRFLNEILRQKSHSLSAEKEELLAKVQELARAPYQIFGMFNNADIHFKPITDDNGEECLLTQGRYISFMNNSSRHVRKEAFEHLYASYKEHINMLAAAYHANARQMAFFAEERKYDSGLAYALDGGNIPTSVYENLLETVGSHLEPMYRYLALRKRALELDELHMYDIYAPMVEEVERKVSFEKAKEIILEGLKPLGEDYGKLLRVGFENRWIDVYENEGKRTGAYSWGAYGVHPYVLLNYQENLNDVFTLAHEMGHALHSWYSDHAQNYLNAGYRIFVAEVASTCNEALLIQDLIEKEQDKKTKAYLINYFLEQFRTTLYRQTMFAQFELDTHRLAEEGKTLTPDVLCNHYLELHQKYYGEGVVSDEIIRYEWARIPHFYTPFYVYQYATGFSAAIAISNKILAGEPGIVEHYKAFLSGGCSMDPIDLLKLCGVDMTTQEPVEQAIRVFETYVKELEALI